MLIKLTLFREHANCMYSVIGISKLSQKRSVTNNGLTDFNSKSRNSISTLKFTFYTSSSFIRKGIVKGAFLNLYKKYTITWVLNRYFTWHLQPAVVSIVVLHQLFIACLWSAVPCTVYYQLFMASVSPALCYANSQSHCVNTFRTRSSHALWAYRPTIVLFLKFICKQQLRESFYYSF